MQTFRIKNPTNQDIKVLFGGQKFTFKANETSTPMREDKARHFATHIARAVSRSTGERNAKVVNKWISEIMVADTLIEESNEGSFEMLAAEVEIEKNENEIIEKEEEIVDEPIEKVVKKTRKPAFE